MGFQMIAKLLSNYGGQMKHRSAQIRRMSFKNALA
jgi:hypothetical protein